MRFETPKREKFEDLVERERRRLAAKARRAKSRGSRGRDRRKADVWYTGKEADGE